MQLPGLLSFTALASTVVATRMSATCRDLQYIVNDYNFQGEAIYSTPSHLAVTQASAGFKLSLPFLSDQAVRCSAPQINDEYPVYSGGFTWYPCSSVDGISAAFKLLEPPGTLSLQVNWTCSRMNFVSEGKANVEPAGSCHDSDIINPDWQPGIGVPYRTISRNCSTKRTIISPSKLSGVAK